MANLIKPSMQQDVMTSFWIMMKECESVAGDENDLVLMHQVECWHKQWNSIMGTDNKPRWMK